VVRDRGLAPQVDGDHVFRLVLVEGMERERERRVGLFPMMRRLRRQSACRAPFEPFRQNVLLSLRSRALCRRRQTR
jgi:hypothetical protein